MPDLWANDNTEYDDDDVYNDYCAELHLMPASVPMINVNLYINHNAPAKQAQGGTKSHYTPVPGGAMLFDTGDKSDYQFSVERLLWVDGWQESTMVAGKLVPKQPMTLIVLKLVLQTFDQDLRVETVKATLQFKDVDRQRADDPEVQAWAPFHDLEDWNPTKAENRSTQNRNATASGGYSGASLSLGWDKGHEISWNQTAFDEGRSILLKSRRKQRPIGVTWSLKQNKLQNLGVSPVLWTAVLIKRKTDLEKYLVKFRLDVRTGTRHDVKSKGLEFLRIKPGDTSSFTATPKPDVWDDTNCFGEGENIRDSKRVDLKNLGKLVGKDRTAMADTWGPQYQRSAPSARGAEADTAETITTTQHITAVESHQTEVCVEAAVAPAEQQPARPGRDPLAPPQAYLVMGSSSPTRSSLGVDTSAGELSRRLVALEARAAHTEARLAAQDLMILQLQRAVDARDAQLSRMEQTMRAAATVLSQL